MKGTQAISSEIVLDRLLDRLMSIVMENAGARRGVLLLEDAGRLSIPFTTGILIGIGFTHAAGRWSLAASPNKKTRRADVPATGPNHPGLLASCLTWLQAGRLK